MFRRSRLSVRPNVGSAGRTAATPQEAPLSSKDSDDPNLKTETTTSVTESELAENPPDQTPSRGDGNDQNVESTSSSAVQRRKRFSIKPKVQPSRSSTLPRTQKSPVKPVLHPAKSNPPVTDKSATFTEANPTAPTQDILSPKENNASDETLLTKIQAKPIIPPSSSPKSVLQAEGASKEINLPADPGKKQSSSCSQVKEVKAQIPPSIPDREAIEISEKAKTLVSKTGFTTSPEQFSLSQLLNDRSDLLRLEKARKLRQLLKQEMHKEKKSKNNKARVKEYSLDPAKMTMRDLIHYLPTSNPMLSSLEESVQENETVVPQSPGREESPQKAQEPEVQPKMLSPRQEATTPSASATADEEAEEEAEEEEEALMVPQVKVAEDGSLIIDEESLTVEVQRMKGPNPIQERDPIFERGSTTTYSSFRKGNYSKPWSTEETDMFFLAISMVGTDFTMICQLFPHRARTEIKNKFKKEERYNAWRIDKAFRERRKLDLEYFTKLLEKIFEFQQNKKKLKSLSDKNKSPKKRKSKSKKATSQLSDVEEENEDEMCDSNDEEEGEKENENLCNEKMSDSTTKKKRKRKNKDPSPERTDGKKKNKRKKKNVQDDLSAPADSEEAVLPEDLSILNQSENTETPESVKDTKSDNLSQGKAVLPLSRKGRKSTQAPKSKAVISDKEGESTSEDVAEKQIEKSTSPPKQANKRGSDNDSSDQETTVQPARPSRYGRVPKPVQPLNYPAREDTHSSASETTPVSPKDTAAKNKKKPTVKRSARQKPVKESKKPKLITLRASQSECSEEEEEEEMAAHMSYDENSTAAFVPASLCSPRPVIPEVEETMEELDMLAHMPDVLGMSENALCPDASCKQLENEGGTVEPCEHQLDLLVDVIDFLSEHTEASEDESYNEAAQTLLTIGSVAAQPTQSQPSMPDPISNSAVFEPTQCTEEEGSSKSSVEEGFTQAIPGPPETENKATEDISVPHTCDTDGIKSSEEPCSTQETVSSQLSSTPEAEKVASPARKGRLSKIKPKPNISHVARSTKLSSKTVCVEIQHVEFATSPSQSAELCGAESATSNSQVANLGLGSSTSTRSETNTEENLEISNLPNEQKHLDHKTTDTKVDALVSSKAVSQMQPDKSTTTESETVTQGSVNQQEGTDIAATCNLGKVLPQEEKTLEQTKEPELENRQETHLDLPLENTSSADIQCTEKAAEDLTPTNITALEKPIECTDPEADIIQSNLETTIEHSAAEEETAHVALVHQLESVSESAKQSTPQRRRRFSKVKPNLVSSPRTTKPREVKDNSQVQPDKSSSIDATSGQQTLKEAIAPTKPEEAEQVKSVNKYPNRASPVASKLAVSLGSTFENHFQDKVNKEPATSSSSVDLNSTTIKLSFQRSGHSIEQSSHASMPTEEPTTLSHSPKISENITVQNTVQQHGEQSATNQANKSTECASSDISNAIGIVCQRSNQLCGPPQDNTLRMTDSDICPDSDTSSTLQTAGFELCTDHQKPLEGAVEPPKELPHNDAEPLLCLDQVQNSSVQDTTMTSETTFEYPSIIFPDMLSDQVPSDPDEPFFILSLTEIPVCPSSGEVVDTRPEPYHSQTDSVAQQSNLVEHVVPAAAGIDDSLSHIHIPTPEKAALNTGLVSVEEYLPSTPVDISILGEPQGNVDVGNARQNLIRKMAAEEAIKHSQIETTQEPQLTAQTEISESIEKIEENIEESDGTLDTGKRRAAKTRGNKRQNRKTKASSDPPSGQKRSQTEKQPPEALAARDEASSFSLQETPSTSCTSEVPGGLSQQDTKGTRGKGRSSRNKKASCETIAITPQSQVSTAALKSPEAVSMDSLKETPCTTSITEPSQTHVVIQQSSSQTSTEPPVSLQSNSIRICFSDEEPTNVSQYFLSDVFTEVESGGSVATEEIKKDTACCDKTQSPTTAKKQNGDILCGQNDAQTTEKQPDANKGASTSDLIVTPSTSSTTDNDPTPQDTKATRGKGRSNRIIKDADDSKAKNSQSQRKSRVALKSEAVSLDSLKETLPTPSTTEPSQAHVANQQCTLQSTSEMTEARQSHIIGCGLSEDEPTNVSQSFTNDIFTEVESGGNLATQIINTKTTLKTQDQTAKTRGNKRQNRKTKASSDPPSGQKTSLTEAQPAEELALVVDDAASSSLVETSSPSCSTEVHADPGQQDTKGTRGKSSRNKTASCETKPKGLQSQRQSRAASRYSAAVSLDTPSTPSTSESSQSHVTNQQSTWQSTSEPPASLESDSMRTSFSDEEPTNVSQYFFSDVFTEVEEEDKL